MFCPNCGTSNEDTAVRCKQCGFELQQAKPAAPKFKGTMLLGKSPFAEGAPGGQPAPGAAPPAAAPPAAGAAAPSPEAQRAALKGTMVGVAPPGVGSATPPPPAAGAQPRGAMKGTMIGIAPPGLGGAGLGGAGLGGAGLGGPGLGGAGGPAAPAGPAGPSAGPGGSPAAAPQVSQVPSKLKGTMIGVAPPGFGAPAATPAAAAPGQRTEAMAATMALPSQVPQVPAGAGSSDSVNPLGGTVLGNPAPDFSAAPQAQGQGAAGGFDQTALGQPPFAQLGGEAPAPAGYGLGALAESQPQGGLVDTLPPGAPPAEAPVAAMPQAPAIPGQLVPDARPATLSGPRGPIGKSRNAVATLLVGMVCFVYAIVAFFQMLGELKAFRQKNDISYLLFFIPIISLIEMWKLPEKVADAQRMAGIQNPQVAHPVLYLFFGLYFMAADLNEAWEAARRSGN